MPANVAPGPPRVTGEPEAYPGGWLPIRYDERCRRQKAALAEALADAIDVCRSRSDVVRLLVRSNPFGTQLLAEAIEAYARPEA